MQLVSILHTTAYEFDRTVQLGPHQLYLRPRDGFDLRISSSRLDISPTASVRWMRDLFNNSVAEASFNQPTDRLIITSQIVAEQYYQCGPQLGIETAKNPAMASGHTLKALAAFQQAADPEDTELPHWLHLDQHVSCAEAIDRLIEMASHIKAHFHYTKREEPGVQSALETLSQGSGSCRDFTWLLMWALRRHHWPTRFVTGYLVSEAHPDASGATHAWLEIFLDALGWVGVDPTCGDLVRGKQIAVATSANPDQLPPIAGSFVGPTQTESRMSVSVETAFINSPNVDAHLTSNR